MIHLLFTPGQIVTTPGALELMASAGLQPMDLLMRHLSGDWGDLDAFDKAENDLSVKEGFRILSSYNVGTEKVWLITGQDRSVTTFLLPDEY